MGSGVLVFFWGGFLWSGELTVPSESGYDEGAHLSFQDVSVDSLTDPQMLQVRLKASKTDPFRAGVDVFVDRTMCKLCPVADEEGQQLWTLICLQQWEARSRFATEVKEALTIAGVDSLCYSGHSFRSEAATTAAE